MDYGRFLMERDLINDTKYNCLFDWIIRNSKFVGINMNMDKKSKNIIPFPKKFKGKREVKIPDYDVMELNEDMAFADNLTEGLIVQVVHMMSENGVKVTSKPFISDLAFIIESIKSSLYRDLDIEHDMQDLMDEFMTTETDEKTKKVNTTFNMELIPEFLKKVKEIKKDK